MKKVAVTGSIASGKSTLCSYFQELGAYVISADAIVHHLLSPTTPVGARVIELLGDAIVVGDKIDREEIAKRVFNDSSLLEELEKLVHPEVQKVIETTYKDVSPQDYPLFVVEIPLLFEAGFESDYDFVIVLTAERGDRKEFAAREGRLMSIEVKKERGDSVFDNSGSLSQLKEFAEKTFNLLTG